MTTLSASRFCRSQCAPLPPRSLLTAMLADVERQMRLLGVYRPFDLRCQAWRLTRNRVQTEFIAQLSVKVEPGELEGRSLASWYEWQHPRWSWVESPLPLELAKTETLPA